MDLRQHDAFAVCASVPKGSDIGAFGQRLVVNLLGSDRTEPAVAVIAQSVRL